jgi:hypothetical protein
MGAIHAPIPLTKITKDNEGIEWLESIGITIPDVDIWSNQPTKNELLEIIYNVENFDIDDEDPTYITITDKTDQRWTVLVFCQDSGKGDSPQDFHFHKGCELATEYGNFIIINCEYPVTSSIV